MVAVIDERHQVGNRLEMENGFQAVLANDFEVRQFPNRRDARALLLAAARAAR